MRKILTAAMLAAIVASPASAHWQYTKWGMTPDQVIAASGGSVQRGNGDRSVQGDATRGATGTYVAGDLTFNANFWFGAKGLASTTLSLKDDDKCKDVQRDLLAKYGTPVEFSGGSVQRRMWADKSTGNRVVLISTGLGYCELQYAPLISDAAAGL